MQPTPFSIQVLFNLVDARARSHLHRMERVIRFRRQPFKGGDPHQRKAQRFRQPGQRRCHIGPDDQRCDQHRIFTVAAPGSRDEIGKTGFIRAKAGTFQIVPDNRASRVMGAKPHDVLKRLEGLPPLNSTQRPGEFVPDPGLRIGGGTSTQVLTETAAQSAQLA